MAGVMTLARSPFDGDLNGVMVTGDYGDMLACRSRMAATNAIVTSNFHDYRVGSEMPMICCQEDVIYLTCVFVKRAPASK